MMETNILANENYGREAIEQGKLRQHRHLFSLSRTRTAQLLGTSTRTITQWEEMEGSAPSTRKLYSMSAARIGQFLTTTEAIHQRLLSQDIDPAKLVPLSTLTALLGISVNSPLITNRCQTGALNCHDLGILGIYVPRDQAETLLNYKPRRTL